MMLRVDHERSGFADRPWTVVLSGPGLGELRTIRADFRTLHEALRFSLSSLRELPGDWDWLKQYPLSPEDPVRG